MIDFGVDARTREQIEEARDWGRSAMRPAGLETDRQGAPLPVEHPYFAKFVERGGGRTRWPGPRGRERSDGEPTTVVANLLRLEELAYWDRGVTVADPGPGLPEGNVLAIAAASEPAPGSVIAKQAQRGRSGARKGPRKRSFCSSLPIASTLVSGRPGPGSATNTPRSQ